MNVFKGIAMSTVKTSAQRFHKTSLLAMAILLTICAPVRAAINDDVDIAIGTATAPTIYVESNGESYTKLSSAKHGNQPITFEANLYIYAGLDKIKSWAVAPRMRIFGKSWGWTFSEGRPPESGWGVVSKSYGVGDRPGKVEKTITLEASQNYIKSFAVNACNANAGKLRNQGKGNTYIFDNEYTLEANTYYSHKISYVSISDPWTYADPAESSGSSSPKNAKIVCMKWGGAQTPQSANDLQAAVNVTRSSLTILETVTANGACKVNLSGMIETSATNAKVKFRYEHTNGNKSEVHTVTTDHSKTAFFSYKYDVPNNPNGGEAGSIRIVGVSPKFESAWKTYDMECNNPAPQGLQALTIPEVKLNMGPGKTIMVDGQICPSAVLLHAQVATGSAFSGKGLFLGDGFFTAPQDIEVPANQVKHVFGKRDLNWDQKSNPANTFAAPSNGGKPPMKTQKVRIGFNLTNKDGKIVAQASQDWYSITCKEPALNPNIPHANGGLSVEPKDASDKNPVLQLKQVPNLPSPSPVPGAPARAKPEPQTAAPQKLKTH